MCASIQFNSTKMILRKPNGFSEATAISPTNQTSNQQSLRQQISQLTENEVKVVSKDIKTKLYNYGRYHNMPQLMQWVNVDDDRTEWEVLTNIVEYAPDGRESVAESMKQCCLDGDKSQGCALPVGRHAVCLRRPISRWSPGIRCPARPGPLHEVFRKLSARTCPHHRCKYIIRFFTV